MPTPIEITSRKAWQDEARCVGTDPDAFFPDKGGSTRDVKRICNGPADGSDPCPVRAQCLEDAIVNDERFGVFGGLAERERRAISRARPTQQRREQEIAPHGTEARARWDRRHKIQPCQRCADAEALARAERKLKAPSVPKECKACHTEKPAIEFAIEVQRPDGLSRNCRTCKAEQYRAWYQANGRKPRKSVA